MLHRVTNTHHLRRTWPHLVNAETGTTLELGPGESADVSLPEKFSDPHLSTAKPKAAAKKDVQPPVAAPAVTEE
jgi:hypothetical protein